MSKRDHLIEGDDRLEEILSEAESGLGPKSPVDSSGAILPRVAEELRQSQERQKWIEDVRLQAEKQYWGNEGEKRKGKK